MRYYLAYPMLALLALVSAPAAQADWHGRDYDGGRGWHGDPHRPGWDHRRHHGRSDVYVSFGPSYPAYAPAPYYPAPSPVNYVVAPAPVYDAPPTAEPYCREYVRDVIVGGRRVQAYGDACQQPDGSWQLMQ